MSSKGALPWRILPAATILFLWRGNHCLGSPRTVRTKGAGGGNLKCELLSPADQVSLDQPFAVI